MGISTILFIALGLAMDAFAASITSGMVLEAGRLRNALRIALFFGLFQGIMPVLGWLIAFRVDQLISKVDHWIAFSLLVIIGCRMIFESVRKDRRKPGNKRLGIGSLLVLSVATSIDAFAVGISFAFLERTIFMPAIIIGSVTFVLSLLGVLIARKLGNVLGRKVGILGGLILIGIGVKILIEHMGV
jgi:putative Mn2+ efflux pump MntP